MTTAKAKKLLRLDIGAGQYRRGEEFTTVDAFGEPDVKAEMWDLPFEADSVEEIWCSHALEHVACANVSKTLAEFLRVLRPGGRAIIQVPNMDYIARYWLTGPDRHWAEQMIFGLQTTDGEYHKSAWTNMVLEADLKGAGFDVQRIEIRWTHNQETWQAVARKPKDPPPPVEP
jgi:predicted SAM-dependent methyltransferase